MMGLFVGLVLFLAAAGIGQHLLQSKHRQEPEAFLYATAAGLLVWGLVGLVLGVIAGLSETLCLTIAGLSALGWARPKVRLSPVWWLPFSVSVILLAPSLWDVAGPIVGTDERYLHIGLPLQFLKEGALLGGPLHPNGSRPLTLHIAYAIGLSTPWKSTAAGMHWWMSVSCLALVIRMGRQFFENHSVGILAAATLALSTTIQHEAGAAGSDLPAALAVLLTLNAALRQHHRAAAICAGLALSLKYTTAAPLFGIWLLMPGNTGTRLRAASLCLLAVAPWWLRNIAEDLHPLFPFAGWSEPAMTFQFVDKYGMGRTALDFVRLPWRMIVEANPASFTFLGRLHPYLLLLLLPFPLVVKQLRFRLWLAASTAGLIGWAVGPHWLRYLIPTLPIIALTGAAIAYPLARSRLTMSLLGLGLVLGGISGLKGYTWPGKPARHPSAGDQAIAFCNRVLGSDDRVAMLFAWRSSDLNAKQLLGSVEDHNPTRHFLMANAGREVDALVQAGATHALVRNTLFLPKTYGFLSAEQFTREFRNPVKQLQDNLIMTSDLLFRSPTHSVYRLPGPD